MAAKGEHEIEESSDGEYRQGGKEEMQEFSKCLRVPARKLRSVFERHGLDVGTKDGCSIVWFV